MIKEIQFSHSPSSFLYVPSFPLSPPVEGATTIRRQRFRLKALPSLQSSRPLFFSSSIRIRSTAAEFFVALLCFLLFLLEILPLVFCLCFFCLSFCLCFCLVFSLFSVKSFFAPDERRARARNLQSSRTTRPQFDRIKKSIMARRAFFFLFFRPLFLPPLGGRAHARGLFSLTRVCFRERFFSLFFAVSKVSRSRAPDVIGLKRMTRETNGFIRSLRADANGSFRVQMSRGISFLAMFFERCTFLTFASSWQSARRVYETRSFRRPKDDPPCGRPLSSRNEV